MFQGTFVVVAGAKVPPLFTFTSLFFIFFPCFFNLFLNSLATVSLQNKVFSFSLFSFLDEDLGIDYVFIPNLSNFETQSTLNVINENNLFKDQVIEEQVRLLNELPKTDYLIMLKGEDVINYRFKISEQLKKRNAIIQLQNIEPSTLASKRNLIF